MKKLHIVITHPHSLCAPGGGTRSCLQISKHLDRLGVNVTLIPVSPHPSKEKISWSSTIDIVPVEKHRMHYLLSGLTLAQKLKPILETKAIDAVICWEHEAAFLPQLLQSNQTVFAMIAALPSYAEWMNRQTGLRPVKTLVDEWFRWRLLRAADVVFVSSNFTRIELTSLLNVKDERIVVTRRGIDPLFSLIKKIYPEVVISNFIFYGSFAPIKGVFDVIEALGYLIRQGRRNWTIKLAGWGDEEAVRKAIQIQGIDQQVKLLGCLSPDELARELAWAHLAILPSRAESFGRAIAEAQAAGLAVVSYDTGSIPEIVEHGVTGWLTPLRHTRCLANSIIEAIDHPETTLKMGLAGRDMMLQKFSWADTVKAILQGIEVAQERLKRV